MPLILARVSSPLPGLYTVLRLCYKFSFTSDIKSVPKKSRSTLARWQFLYSIKQPLTFRVTHPARHMTQRRGF